MAELIVGIFAWVCPTLTAVVGLLCVEFGDVALEAYAGGGGRAGSQRRVDRRANGW
jgi:hypothetical protein